MTSSPDGPANYEAQPGIIEGRQAFGEMLAFARMLQNDRGVTDAHQILFLILENLLEQHGVERLTPRNLGEIISGNNSEIIKQVLVKQSHSANPKSQGWVIVKELPRCNRDAIVVYPAIGQISDPVSVRLPNVKTAPVKLLFERQKGGYFSLGHTLENRFSVKSHIIETALRRSLLA